MLVLSHSDTHYLNRYMGWCGCHEILIALCYSERKSFDMIKKSVHWIAILYLDDTRIAQRWQWNTNRRHTKINPDDWMVRCRYPWMLVNWICLCFSLFPCSRTLTLIVVDSSFTIEEFLHKMGTSLKNGRVRQNNHSYLADWPDPALSSQHLRRFLDILSVHLCIPVSLPLFHCTLWSAFDLPQLPAFSHSTSLSLPYLSLSCPKHNSRRRSLSMLVLPHSDTHTLPHWIYGMVRVPRDLDSSFSNYPVLVEFLWFVVNCLWILSVPLFERWLWSLLIRRRSKMKNSSTK